MVEYTATNLFTPLASFLGSWKGMAIILIAAIGVGAVIWWFKINQDGR